MTDRPKGSPTAETAQTVFSRLLRDLIAPALRDLGFKGSGARYKMTRDEYRIEIEFQKSKWSTRDSVQFDVFCPGYRLHLRHRT